MEGPRGEKSDKKTPISIQPEFGAFIPRRGLPLRPYLHVRISRISGRRAQLPQINISIDINIDITGAFLIHAVAGLGWLPEKLLRKCVFLWLPLRMYFLSDA